MTDDAKTPATSDLMLSDERAAFHQLHRLAKQLNEDDKRAAPELTLQVASGETIWFPASLLAALEPLLAALAEGKGVSYKPEENIPLSDAAEILGMTTSEIEAQVAAGRLTAIDPPTERLVPLHEVYELIDAAAARKGGAGQATSPSS